MTSSDLDNTRLISYVGTQGYVNIHEKNKTNSKVNLEYGGARGVMVIVVGNGHGDTSSNPGWNWLHFTWH